MADRETVADNLMRLTDEEADTIRRKRLDADRCIECAGATYEPHAWWCCWSVSRRAGDPYTAEQRASRAHAQRLILGGGSDAAS